MPVVSFSGGVADCIYAPPGDWKAYGDIGVLLGRAIAVSPAFQAAGRFRGEETIRATVVGRGATPPSCPAPPSTTGTLPSP